jgi:ABC-type uncharacterized transport system ATPase component
VIELSALEKTFEQPGGERVPALRGVDLTIPGGQFLTVIGSNGSGKSTILNVVAGTYLPDAGGIGIAGTDVTRWPEHRRAALLGRVFQDPFKGTCPSMTVAENLRMAELRGKRRGLRVGLDRASLERYRAGLASMGMRLEGRLEATMGTLSGGQRQAVTLLMATIGRPMLLLLDEHTAALDPRARGADHDRHRPPGAHARAHDAHGHAQHGAGCPLRRPDDHDAPRRDRRRPLRRRAARRDGSRPPRALRRAALHRGDARDEGRRDRSAVEPGR